MSHTTPRRRHTFRPTLESLEQRDCPAPVVRPLANPSAAIVVTPAEDRHAYGLDQLRNQGRGMTVAVVDAFSSPTLRQDLHAFDLHWGLKDPVLTEAYPDGGPTTDPQNEWPIEIALDVEWAHVVAPQARILFVGASVPNGVSLMNAEAYAMAHGVAVSNSWGTGAFAGDGSLDYFLTPQGNRAAVLASSGDNAALEWPAHAKPVLSVGGTTLNVTSPGGKYLGERLWPRSGPGGDVAYDSDPASGFPILAGGHWYVVGGTSAASPQWAAIVALADELRRQHHLPLLETADVKAWLKHAPRRDFHQDPAHDLPGSGSPVSQRLVPDLAKAKALPAETALRAAVGVPSDLVVSPGVVVLGESHKPARPAPKKAPAKVTHGSSTAAPPTLGGITVNPLSR